MDPKRQEKVDKERDKANEELAKGDADAGAGKPKEAIEHYKKAWEHAQKATAEAEQGPVVTNRRSKQVGKGPASAGPLFVVLAAAAPGGLAFASRAYT